MAAIHRQHFVEVIAQRVTDERLGPLPLDQRAAVARLVNEVFLSMTVEEFARGADLYLGWKPFQLMCP